MLIQDQSVARQVGLVLLDIQKATSISLILGRVDLARCSVRMWFLAVTVDGITVKNGEKWSGDLPKPRTHVSEVGRVRICYFKSSKCDGVLA